MSRQLPGPAASCPARRPRSGSLWEWTTGVWAMNWGHDSGLSGGGLCGCAGCASGHAAALDGRQALTASQTSGDSIVDAIVAGGWPKWGPVWLMGTGVTVHDSFMTAPPSHGPDRT